MKATLRFEDDSIEANVNEYFDDFDKMMRLLCDYHAAAGEANMKTEAPWTDRTGLARQGLFSVTDHGENRYTIVFSHSMEYGFWLEVKFSGRDAVIMPTVLSQGRALMEDIERALS